MKPVSCRTVPLGALIDGELSGADRLRVIEHLEACGACATEVREMESIGQSLRAAAAGQVAEEMGGLADGVFSRIRAERAQSWRGMLDRALDGWHWLLVGGGSCAAAALSILFVSALVQFGPAPGRDDSLAALLQNRNWQVVSSPFGQMYVWAVPVSRPVHQAERDLIGAYVDALGSQGKPINLGAKPKEERLYVDTLFEQIQKLEWNAATLLGLQDERAERDRTSTPAPAEVSVYKIQLITTTAVSAKGL